MFKNKELTIKLNKPTKPYNQDEAKNEAKTFEDRVALLHTVAKSIAKTVIVGVCGFVVLDTARQVLIAKNTQPYPQDW